ncbi:MAG: ABC transporter permease, partial [Pedobacter sp.]|nr:ABC transporter permease [Chitinophagaceae bacterium]
MTPLVHPKIKTIIDSKSGSGLFNFKEFWAYKDLLYFMVLRDVTVLYKQTVLGFAWAIINPLFQIIVFSLIFGRLVGVNPNAGTMPYPVFSCLAIIPWTYFSNSLNASATSLIASNHILSKVYFPRVIFPLVPVLSKLVDLSISFIILIGLSLYFHYIPTTQVVFIIVPLILVVITSAGLGFWFSALSVQYRDFKFALSFTLPLLMYAAPVVFPATMILEKLGKTAFHLYSLYPMVGVIEGFRCSFAIGKSMPWQILGISYLSAIIIFITGL